MLNQKASKGSGQEDSIVIPRHQLESEVLNLEIPLIINVRYTCSNKSMSSAFGGPTIMHEAEHAIIRLWMIEKTGQKEGR